MVAWAELGLLTWCQVLLSSPQEHLCVLPSPRRIGSFGAGAHDVGGPSGASGHSRAPVLPAVDSVPSGPCLCVSEAAVAPLRVAVPTELSLGTSVVRHNRHRDGNVPISAHVNYFGVFFC